jgi:hypothetical protein
MTETKTGLSLLRGAFPSNQISKLPKGTKAQNECPAEQKRKCSVCGGWHHPQVIHLDYVGHAALTDRLLDADPLWTWEPFALKEGLPAFDTSGGLWIKLTVCGHTRIGYGHAAASSFKEIGSREKEVIGDALRNAAMRFGAALDLWHKGDLHAEIEDTPAKVYLLQGKEQPKVDGMGEPLTDIPEPEIPPAEQPTTFLEAGTSLHKTIEQKIKDYQINRDQFKAWLMEKKKIGLRDERPSFMTMTVTDANKMLEKWNTVMTQYQTWLSKQSGS